MKIRIDQLNEWDAEALFSFEVKNRSYFKKMVPDRGSDYYHFDTFKNKLDQLLIEQSEGQSTFYLIKDEHDSILGRINLIDFNPSNGDAELGYRIGEQYTRNGIATKALKLLLKEICHDNRIKRISARTTNDHVGSQKVLERNGFKYESTDRNEVVLNGTKVKLIHYQWSN